MKRSQKRLCGLAVSCVALGILAHACTPITGVAIDDDAAAPTGTTTTTAPTTTSTAPPVPTADGAVMTNDAAIAVDGGVADADTDGGADADTDADVDAGSSDAGGDAMSDAGGPIPVLPGADGVLRGTVGGAVTHSWVGQVRLPNAGCPPGARIYTSGMYQCCGWSGSFGAVANMPVEFDLTTGSGTLAGAPIGALSALGPDVDGTLRFRQAAFLHATKGWNASVAMATLMMAPPAKVTEARDFLGLGIVRPISDSLRNMTVTWNPTTKLFRVVSDLTMFQANATGQCAPGLPSSEARLLFDLRGP